MRTVPKSVIPFLIHFMKKHQCGFIIIALSATTVHVSSNTLWPYIMGELVSAFNELDVSKTKSISTLFWPMMWALVFWASATLAHSLKGFTMSKVNPLFCADIRKELFDGVMHHKHTYFVHKHIGGIAQRISELPRSAQYICDNTLTVFGPIGISIALSSLVFCTVHYIPSIIFAISLVVYLAIVLMLGRYASRYSDEHAASMANLYGTIVDSIRNHFNIRVFNGISKEKMVIDAAQNNEIRKNKRSLFFIEKLKLILGIWEILSVTTLLWVSVILWQKSELTVGDLVFIANSIFNITGCLWFAVDEITYTFKEIGVCSQGLTLLHDDMNDGADAGYTKYYHESYLSTSTTGANAKKTDLTVTKAEIVFHNVNFKYKTGHKIFDGKSLRIRGGEKVGLVGFSGSGKTTFAYLIMRIYELESGNILIDEQDISKVSTTSLRRNISFIQQEPILFHRSVMENIRYGNFNATDEEVIEASIKAHAHDFIENMPDRYNSTVGEMGTRLSGGQRQRIAIARAILHNAPILIMDEATSALDSVTEKKIQQSLDYLMHSKTVIVIAHRLSTILHMDRIIVFDKGKIVEQGTHDQLIAKNGYYSSLWSMQQDGILPDENGD